MSGKIGRSGRRQANPAQSIGDGTMTRIPRNVHPAIKKAAQAAGLSIGRFLVQCGAMAVGEKVEAAKCRVPKRKSAA